MDKGDRRLIRVSVHELSEMPNHFWVLGDPRNSDFSCSLKLNTQNHSCNPGSSSSGCAFRRNGHGGSEENVQAKGNWPLCCLQDLAREFQVPIQRPMTRACSCSANNGPASFSLGLARVSESLESYLAPSQNAGLM